MIQVNMHEAKTNFSKLIAAIKSGRESEIVVAQNGVPAARIVPVEPRKRPPLLGSAEGKWVIPDDIDSMNGELEKLFDGDLD
jgi:prevent-host-death family protein